MSSRRTAVVVSSTELLKDKRCTTMRNRCLLRPDKECTEAIQRYFHDGTPTKNTESHRSIGFSRLMQKEEQQSLSQRPDFAQAKRVCKPLHDEHLAMTQEEYRGIPRNQQRRQRKGQQFEGNEEYDYGVDPKTGWRFYKRSRRNLQTTSSGSRQPANSFVIVVNVGPNPLEDEQLEFSVFFKP